jgi:glycyl-tRNA synthetase beta subunit
MVDDRAVRENRLRLMQHIADLARGVIDLLEIEGY